MMMTEYIPNETEAEFMKRLDEQMPTILRDQGVPLEDIISSVYMVQERLQQYAVEYGHVIFAD